MGIVYMRIKGVKQVTGVTPRSKVAQEDFLLCNLLNLSRGTNFVMQVFDRTDPPFILWRFRG